MAKFGAGNIWHQFLNTTGKFGTKLPDSGTTSVDREWSLLDPGGFRKAPKKNFAKSLNTRNSLNHTAQFGLFRLCYSRIPNPPPPPVLKRSVIFHSKITEVLFKLDKVINTGPRSHATVHVQKKVQSTPAAKGHSNPETAAGRSQRALVRLVTTKKTCLPRRTGWCHGRHMRASRA